MKNSYVRSAQSISMLQIVKMTVRNEINFINRQQNYGRSKKDQSCGAYVKELYEQVASGVEVASVDLSKLHQPTFVLTVAQLMTAESNGVILVKSLERHVPVQAGSLGERDSIITTDHRIEDEKCKAGTRSVGLVCLQMEWHASIIWSRQGKGRKCL